ncbi:TerC family protein [Glycomyces paridis]|uniref:TerC family protein n=1 Tax=Glycomyces paridis TaxID=2126555 RepID=A0A4S8PF55_9ACTN|nr:TerC family protein [Glycomyces paridis]
MELLTSPEAWFALLTLTVLELILGIDNVVFISVLASRLPQRSQLTAWRVGLLLALVSRVGLLLSVSWLVGLRAELFAVGGHGVSGRDLILLAGGGFLVVKSVKEIAARLSRQGEAGEDARPAGGAGLAVTLVQIMLMDMVFSIDSILTAVGLAREVAVMVAAVVVAIAITLAAARSIHGFIGRHPRVTTIGLAFLVLIGAGLVLEGLGVAVPKAYLYAPIGFALAVEWMNIRAESVHRYRTEAAAAPEAEEA